MSLSLHSPSCIFLQQNYFIFHVSIATSKPLEMIRLLSIILLATIIAAMSQALCSLGP